MSHPPIDPSRSALLVMDYQGSVLGGQADPDGLVERANQLLDAFRGKGGHVGYVRVGFQDSDYDALPAHSRFAPIAADEKMRAAMHADSPMTAIDERVSPQEADMVVRKTRVGPFSSTDLHEQLQSRGIDTLVLAGLTTSGVVLSTVRQAADFDYRVVVASDACADPDPETHATLIEKVFPRQADVASTQEVVDLLG
jgi:nicotinamidase-related amidase